MKRAFTICLMVFLLTALTVAQQAAAPARQAAPHAAASPAPVPADKIWAELMAGNQRFISGQPKTVALVSLRQSLAKSQHPKAIVLSCSDSRVAPELVFDQSLG